MGYFGGGGGIAAGDNVDFTGDISVIDEKFNINDDADATKKIEFEASGITTGNTRVVTMPDSNTTLPIFDQIITFTGPTTARTFTLPDGNQTLAALATSQTFSGIITFSNDVTFTDATGGVNLNDNVELFIGNTPANDGTISHQTAQTPDGLVIGTGVDNNSVIICESADRTFDFAHAVQTNPTVFVHSANQNTTQWIGLTHDATSGVISTGTGPVIFTLAGTQRMAISTTPLLERTITGAGTTGAQTINKMAGTVNFAAAATTLVVTNSLVTVDSIVFAVVRTADATATIKSVVPAAGSFTITLGAAATAETSVGFWVTN